MAKAPAGAPVPVVVMGLGFIGQEVARAALQSEEVELVGAVDSSPQLFGKKLSEVLKVPAGTFAIQRDLAKALGDRKGAVLLHATGSRLPQVMDQLLDAMERGMSIVSSCEELSFPWLKHATLAEKLEKAAKKSNVSVLGTGVNPGFVLDRLVATIAQACGVVHRVKATRVVDARTRREALQRKVGGGITEDEFMKLVDAEKLGHVGLTESCALAALGVGIDCDDFEEELLPVIADEDIEGGAFKVKKGQVAGIHQTAVGLSDGQERVRLELTIALGAEDPGDRIEIEGEPKIVLHVPNGVAGDRATANLMVNAAPRVSAAEPGLLTVLELPAGR
jgi:4-hydroxy-tetrahydrodipicolinate reductase